ncbi:MAG: YigZ family protein [Candidatus Cloacimonetes bacterium]|nr:YigZ family protein [Candidatus Cloacimonadota bacterium]
MKYSIKEKVSYEHKIQRSRFICVLYPVSCMEDIRELLTNHQQIYADATHNCYAYLLGEKQDTVYYSDAGEPSGTAGKPMLNALLSKNMTNVLAVVTRYFGGIKLGVKGLIDAYRCTVSLSIEQAELYPYEEYLPLSMICTYQVVDQVKSVCLQHRAKLLTQNYEDRVFLGFDVPMLEHDALKNSLAAFAAQKYVEFV